MVGLNKEFIIQIVIDFSAFPSQLVILISIMYYTFVFINNLRFASCEK